MNQYCRYCANCCITENESIIWCEVKMEIYSASKAKRLNKCKDFDFNPNDVFGQNEDGTFKQYNPREKYRKHDKAEELEQIQIGW